MVEPVFGGKRVQSITLGRAANAVIAAQAGIQVTDRVRHTAGKRYPGMGMDPGFHRGDDKDWIPAFAGIPKAGDVRRRFDRICRAREDVSLS